MFTLFAQRLPSRSRAKRGLGFTLIELTLVIVVVGILGSVAMAIYQNFHYETRATHMGELMGSFEWSSCNNLVARKAGSSKAMLLNQANVCAADMLPKLFQMGTPIVGGKPIKFDANQTGNCSQRALTWFNAG